MFDRLKIRSKLVVLLAAPLLALLVLAGTVAVARTADADQTKQDGRLLEAATLSAKAAHEMQVETELAVRFTVTGDVDDRDAWSDQAAVTDKAIKAMMEKLRGLDTSELDSATRASLSLIERTASSPDTVRNAVRAQAAEWDLSIQGYQNLSDAFVQAALRLANSTENPQVNAEARSWGLAVQIEADVAAERALLTGAFSDGRFERVGTIEVLQESVARGRSNVATLEAFGAPAVRDAIRTALSGNVVSTADSMRQEALDTSAGQLLAGGADGPRLDVNADEWREASLGKLDRVRDAEVKAGAAVLERADQLTQDAEQSARFSIIAALLVVIVAIALAAWVGRRITRPLLRLTAAADTLAREQLPRLVESLRNPAENDVEQLASSVTAIDISGKDEIGQLAKSFNTVQTVAVDVATEQAALLRKGIGEMFVNLARRNQTLLDRQIEFLDKLEADEENPDQLDNLFKLDHMATRMRRNAESLLVLAGAEPTRRRGRPVPLADVVRSALAEVEDFNRIDLLSFDDVLLASNSASDMAHLLSELMENATNFSPPDTRVEVVGHRTSADGYTISVTDQGIGMSQEQLDEHNELLAQPPLVGLTLSRSLGFIVIGRLAARFGVTVRLMSSSAGGVTAAVSLPSSLITDPTGAEPVADPELAESPVVDVSDEAPDEDELVEAPYDHEDDKLPASLRDAVPGGDAFDQGLAAMIDEERGTHDAEDEAEAELKSDGAVPPAPPRGDFPTRSGSPRGRISESGRADGGMSEHLVEPLPGCDAESQPDLLPIDMAGVDAGPEAIPELLPEGLPAEPPSAPVSGSGVFGPSAKTSTNGASASKASKSSNGSRSTNGSKPASEEIPAERSAVKLFGSAAAAEAAPETIPAPTASAATEAETTDGSLPSRLPRRTAGGSRPKPGGEGRQVGVTQAKRSPDEVRNMLSAYRGGVERGRVADQSSDTNGVEDQS